MPETLINLRCRWPSGRKRCAKLHGLRVRALVVVAASVWMTLTDPTAHAFGERLSVAASANGAVTVTLSGMMYPCTAAFVAPPAVSIAAAQIAITSQTVVMGCPIVLGAPPSPYSQIAILGVLPQGAYAVSWNIQGATQYLVRTPIQMQFVVGANNSIAIDWPQFAFDAQHSGNNAQEALLTAANVAALRPLYHVTLPSIADGAPAYFTSAMTAGGVKDLLFLTTKAGHLLALDAQTGALLWSHQPATGPRYTTSSPAIDPGRQYVYGYALDGKAHRYDVLGNENLTGGWPQIATLKPDVEKGSAALTAATVRDGTPYLYVANGGYPGDAGDYQGHVTAINLATGGQIVFNAACSDQSVHFRETAAPDCLRVQTAVWARPGVVYDADLDRILFSTGNGVFDANSGGFDWGDSVLAVAPTGSAALGLPLDSYTPTEFQQLQNADADLGSTAPALLPALPTSRYPHLAAQSGKDAKLRLLNLDNMSGAGKPGQVGGELQKITVPQGGEVLTQPAVWMNPADGGIWVFISNGNGIAALQLTVDALGNPALATRWMNTQGGSSPIVANSVVYYAGPGRISALDPISGRVLWSDTSIGGIHWESPIVVNGKLYVTDENAALWAYALAYTIAPASNFFPYAGGAGQVAVAAATTAPWTAAANASWLAINAGAAGTGNGTVSFSVAANSTGAPRTGTLTIASQIFTVAQLGPPPGGSLPIVEYWDSPDDDYFITADPAEQAALDAAAAAGAVWSRTGLGFNSGGNTSVYRFIYKSPSGVNTHFYTVNTNEQSSLLANNPYWVLESPVAFYMTAANPDQTCPGGTLLVYRAVNEHTGSHRFATQQGAINQVLARGWTNEGVAFCAP
jgi:hypothetical protein